MTPEQLKASILQYAIQGKLVEQRLEEGTGEELYQQIQEEKQRLIKEGKIKREKPLPEITEDEIPFDIPDSWKWVKLGDCTSYSKTKEKVSPRDITGDMWSLDLEDIQKDTGTILVKTTASERKISGDKVKFYKGQVLYSKLRPYLKKILVAPDNGICTPELVPFDTYLIDENYIAYVLRSPHIDYIINSVTYGVKMPRVGTDTMTNLLIPLPPLVEQKRIVAKIEELLPHIDRYAVAYEKLEQFNAKFPEDMKKSILQYAIQGKLVEQRPEEGTGEELYQRIQTEKKRLIKEGKIRKEKPLPEITEDEIPFDIPESWKWVRFSKLMNSMSTGPFGSMLHKSDYVSNGIPLVNPANIINGSIIASDKMMVSEETAKRLSSYALETGMIVMGRRGEMGRCAVVGKMENGWLCGTGSFFMMPTSCVFVNYLSMFLHTSYAKGYLSGASVGTTMSNLNHKILNNMPVPLPPYAEQKRIVAKLEEILPLCERLK